MSNFSFYTYVFILSVSAMSSILALSLLSLQSWRRFYETWFVSIFSDSRMNLSHYLVGFIHYFGAVTAILAESPGFIDDKGKLCIQGDPSGFIIIY